MSEFGFKVITHNIAGGAVFNGAPTAMAAVEQQITQFAPDLVLMQEVCYSGQLLPFRQAHPSWSTRFAVSRVSHPGCGDGTVGTVIASPHPLSSSWSVDLPHWSHDRENRLLGADLTLRGVTFLVAVVHLKVKWAADQSEEFYGTEPGSEQLAQVQKVADTTRTYKSRGPVVVGGDFNIPLFGGAIQPMKDRYDEARAGTADAGRIDHVWWGGQKTVSANGSEVSGQGSDHPLVRATVRVLP